MKPSVFNIFSGENDLHGQLACAGALVEVPPRAKFCIRSSLSSSLRTNRLYFSFSPSTLDMQVR